MSIPLGARAKDRITGLEGIVTSRTEYLTGCVHLCIEPEGLTAEGKRKEHEFVDETRCEQVGTEIFKLSDVGEVTEAKPKSLISRFTKRKRPEETMGENQTQPARRATGGPAPSPPRL